MRRLLALAQAQIGSLSAADATFLLDGCARLDLRPASQLLDALATQVGPLTDHHDAAKCTVGGYCLKCRIKTFVLMVEAANCADTGKYFTWAMSSSLTGLSCMRGAQLAESAATLEPAQLPLVLWAFASLGHRPTPGVLTALEGQARLVSSQLTAQVCNRIRSFASYPSTMHGIDALNDKGVDRECPLPLHEIGRDVCRALLSPPLLHAGRVAGAVVLPGPGPPAGAGHAGLPGGGHARGAAGLQARRAGVLPGGLQGLELLPRRRPAAGE